MGSVPELFQGLKITCYYKYLLYLAGIIFILSLFVEVHALDVSVVRRGSFGVIIAGLAIWLLQEILEHISNLIYEWNISSHKSREDYLTAVGVIVGINYFVQILILIFAIAYLKSLIP